MSLYSDHPIRLVDNRAHFDSSANQSRTLQPGDFFDVVGQVAGGLVKVGA